MRGEPAAHFTLAQTASKLRVPRTQVYACPVSLPSCHMVLRKGFLEPRSTEAHIIRAPVGILPFLLSSSWTQWSPEVDRATASHGA